MYADLDALDEYFECITECNVDDQTCTTECVTVLKLSQDDAEEPEDVLS